MEVSLKEFEQACDDRSRRLQHFQELDKESVELTAGLKTAIARLQNRCNDLERQKSVIEQQKVAVSSCSLVFVPLTVVFSMSAKLLVSESFPIMTLIVATATTKESSKL